MVGLCSLRDVVVELKRLKSQPSDQQEVEGAVALLGIEIESEEFVFARSAWAKTKNQEW